MTISPSTELLALMASKPLPDAALMRAYELGEITTCPARRRTNGDQDRYGGRFTRHRYQQSPDRQASILRRRRLGSTWPMPPHMAAHLTESQKAYARIVADEISTNGICDRTLDEIAARGGMCSKTAQRAQHRLRLLGWITVEDRPRLGRKHLPNVVRIVSPEWRTWIELGPRPRLIGGHRCPATENHSVPKKKSGSPRQEGARSGPHQRTLKELLSDSA